jgi:polyhydroxybutyrate depolymerase
VTRAALILVVLFAGTAADAGTPAQKCAAEKLKAEGKKAGALLNCQRKAAKIGEAVDPRCVTATDRLFHASFAKAEANGGCAVTGDESTARARIDQWADDLATLLRPTSTASGCASLKLRAAGRKAVGLLRCHASGMKQGAPASATCLANVEQKFRQRFASAEGSPPCLTTGDEALVGERADRVADALRAAALSGCLVNLVTAGDATRTFASGGIGRTYRLHVPPAYAPGQLTPLVFSFHGGTSNATQQAFITQMHAKADSAGFLLIEAEGYGGPFNLPTWNAGNCCGPAMTADIDDVAFVDAMIDHLGADACVDARRVFSTGYSNGAMLSYRLACELADRIAAIAPNAGGVGDVNQNVDPPVQVFTCAPSRPVPVFHMHGDADTCYRFEGGVGTGVSGTNFISIPTTIAGWVARNGCSSTTVTTYQNGGATCDTYQGCVEGADVTLCVLAGHGHAWPGGAAYGLEAMCGGVMSSDLIANDALWDFFVAHPMP